MSSPVALAVAVKVVVDDVIVEDDEEEGNWIFSFTLSTRNADNCGGPRRDDNGIRKICCKPARLTEHRSRAIRAFV